MSIKRDRESVSYSNICASPCVVQYIEARSLPKPEALRVGTPSKGTNTISSTDKSAF